MKICRKLWPFWATRERQNQWKKGAQGIGNPPKMVGKKQVFGSFLGVFWGPGPVWEPSRFGSRKKCQKWSGFGLDFGSFLGRFGTFWCLVEGVFFVCFQGRPFCALWAIWWPRGGQKRGFWRPFRHHLGGGPDM